MFSASKKKSSEKKIANAKKECWRVSEIWSGKFYDWNDLEKQIRFLFFRYNVK